MDGFSHRVLAFGLSGYEPSKSRPLFLRSPYSLGYCRINNGRLKRYRFLGIVMSGRFLAPRAAKGLWATNLGLALLCLATMAGCQGFSSSKSSLRQQSGALAMSGASLDFGNVDAGTSKTLTATASNTGTASVTITSASISSKYFSLSAPSLPAVVGAGQSSTISFVFSPNAAGAFSATVSITSNASNSSALLSLSGTGVANGQLAANPTSESFGTVRVQSNQKLWETVTNTGGTTVTISQVGISGAGFTLSGISTPVTLTAGQAASFSVTFAPQSAGSASGSVTVSSNGSNPTLTIPLSGTGATAAGQLTATPAPIAVGNVVAGTSGTVSGSLNASGSNVTVTAASTNNSRFTISGLSLPVIIPSGQSAAFKVTFSPQVAGADGATLTFTSNAQPSTTTDTATGTGTPGHTHTVTLSWSASTSPNISGYNVYRAVYVSSCGAYSKINGSALDTVTTYSDFSVIDGTNYCYATTAVNSGHEESGYSNIVSDVRIPAP